MTNEFVLVFDVCPPPKLSENVRSTVIIQLESNAKRTSSAALENVQNAPQRPRVKSNTIDKYASKL